MRKVYTLLSVMIFTSFIVDTYGQDSLKKRDYKNAISLEVLGNGILLSLNYERTLLQENIYCLSSRFGISYFPKLNGFNDDFQGPGFIFELTNSLGKSNKKIELGIGINAFNLYHKYDENIFINDKYEKFIFLYTSPRIGYKYESPNRYIFRIGFTPIILLKFETTNTNAEVIKKNGNTVLPWIGIGIGKIF